MASLSRGLRHPIVPPFFAPKSIRAQFSNTPQSRFFTTILHLRAAIPSIKPSKSSLPSKTALSTSTSQTSYALVKSLATKSTPTILYEGPSNFWFYFGCWTSGISILAWTGLTGPKVVFQPEGVPEFVGWVYGASYILLGAMGFYLISKTPNIVSSIRVLPAHVVTKPLPGATPAQLRIEVTVKRMLPILGSKVLVTTLDKVSLKSRFSLPDEYVPELKRLEAKRQAEKRSQEQRKYDMERLMTMPFRQIGRVFKGMFLGVRAAWTDMGYGVIKVDGTEYKVNVVKGFAHDGFRTLERIVPVKTK